MLGVFLSGTGNTKYCLTKLKENLNEEIEMIPLEDENVIGKIKENNRILLAYPTQYSNVPYMVRDFINSNKELWKDKEIILLSTMGLFSGDATGCAARLLKKYKAKVIGGMQVSMPDSIGDVKALKKSKAENKNKVKKASAQMKAYAEMMNEGKYPHRGLSFLSMMIGLFGQRLYFISKTKNYSTKLKIDESKCIKCQKCVSLCPMHNLEMIENQIKTKNQCTMCYRCISNCPKQAITLLGNEVHEQCKIENYI